MMSKKFRQAAFALFTLFLSVQFYHYGISANGKVKENEVAVGSLVEKRLASDKETRIYYEYVPTGYKTQKTLPLLIMLHGAGGDPVQLNNTTNWTSLAEKNNFIVVYPYKQGWWDAYNWEKNADDRFLSDLIHKLQTDYKINKKKVFLCGYSIGASMAATYTFKHAKSVAAIALVSPAWMDCDPTYDIDPYEISQPQKQISVYAMRGETEGWPSQDEIQSMIQYWNHLNHISNKPSVVRQDKYTTYTYDGKKADVLYAEIANGTHFSYVPADFEKIWTDFFSRY